MKNHFRPPVSAQRSRIISMLAIIGAASLWSTSFTMTKIALIDMPPLTIGSLRFALAAVGLAGILAASNTWQKPRRGDRGWLVLGGLLGTTVYFSLENMGVNFATATDAALLIATFPAMTMLLEIGVYRIPPAPIRFVGVGLAMFGSYLIVNHHPQGANEHRFVGDIILIGAGIVWAFYSFVTQKVSRAYSSLTVVFYQTLFGTLAFIPLALLEWKQWKVPSPHTALILLYLGMCCSVFAFVLYTYGLKNLDSGSAVNFLNLVPVLGVVIAFFFLQESVDPLQIVGSIIAIFGVMLGVQPQEQKGHAFPQEKKDV